MYNDLDECKVKFDLIASNEKAVNRMCVKMQKDTELTQISRENSELKEELQYIKRELDSSRQDWQLKEAEYKREQEQMTATIEVLNAQVSNLFAEWLILCHTYLPCQLASTIIGIIKKSIGGDDEHHVSISRL
jgi:regulator of replication initiation timing